MSALATAIAQRLGELYTQIAATNTAAIAAAAHAIASAVDEDRVVHVFGPGAHSQLSIQEVFYRPGMLAAISPTFDEGTLLTVGGAQSTRTERIRGRGDRLVEASGLGSGDVALLVNASGVNATAIETATAVTERGATLIGYSSRACEEAVDALHPARFEAGVSLSRLADIHVETCVPVGDAASVAGGQAAVPLATAAQSFSLLWTFTEVARLLGDTAPVWASSYADGGDARNAELFARYASRVPSL